MQKTGNHMVNFLDERLPSRFWNRVIPEPNSGCWLWLTYCDREGYGIYSIKSRSLRAHRVAYQTLVSEIPNGLVIDHRCRNTSCVNPVHLEAVTDRVNILRGEGPSAKRAAQTVCIKGHPFTYQWRNQRHCKQCNTASARAYRERRRESR